MRILFQNPLWIAGALALAPVLAHLFSRTRPRVRSYPSIYLLQEALRRVTRVRKPRDIWLLILRTLAASALALAFLQPALFSSAFEDTSAASTAVLLVDSTASMGYTDGARSRMAQAVQAAEDFLGTLPAGSEANVVWLRTHSEAVLPDPGRNLDFLRQSLRRGSAHPESGDPVQGLSLAVQQLAGARGKRELVVISDFQKANWQQATWDLPKGIKLTRIAVGREAAANSGLGQITMEPASPIAGQPVTLGCRVRNFSGEPRRANLLVEAGGQHLQASVEVLPWSETPASVRVTFPQEGVFPVHFNVAEDRFPADDERFALADVKGSSVIAIAGAAENATVQAWTRAVKSLDATSARVLDPAKLGVERDASAVMAADWTGAGLQDLAAFIRKGGVPIVQPAPGLDPAIISKLLGNRFEVIQSNAPPDKVWRLATKAEEHPVFRIFASGAFGEPVGGSVRKRGPALKGAGCTNLIECDDGHPAVQWVSTETGSLVWWPADLAGSDWTARSNFVVFLGELLKAATAGAPGVNQADTMPGEKLRLEDASKAGTEGIRLLDSQEHEIAIVHRTANGMDALESEQPAVPGEYRWSASGAVLDRTVVNFPESESDLRTMTEADLQSLPGATIAGAQVAVLDELREGKPLWPWLVGFATVCLLAEGGVILGFRGHQQAERGGAA